MRRINARLSDLEDRLGAVEKRLDEAPAGKLRLVLDGEDGAAVLAFLEGEGVEVAAGDPVPAGATRFMDTSPNKLDTVLMEVES